MFTICRLPILTALAGAGMLLFTATASAQNMATYDANFSQADLSQFSASGGGIIRVPYYLTSGADINSGQPIWAEYQFSALTNNLSYLIYKSGSSSPTTTLTFGVSDSWSAGMPTTTTASFTATAPQTIGDYTFQSGASHHYVITGTIDSPVNVWDLQQRPYYTYGNTSSVTWNMVTYPNSTQTSSEIFALYSDPTSTNGLRTSLVYVQAVPEPTSGALLAAGTGALLLLRRRKA